ncbi:PAS domain S-box protein [Methanohalophilus sp.]|uniref:PAS domain S-box protein n=1 Tax=Methanohalophilus sp. TaxID=1966352 RepID=UPI0026050E2C|nr:PAS domain S-box protein [Methanohalophilus sp.]MDK2891808.1 hypothetical protein [Methanohalophilus sp.]
MGNTTMIKKGGDGGENALVSRFVTEDNSNHIASTAEDLVSIFSECLEDCILVVKDCRIAFANKKFSEIVGKEIQDILGTSFLDYFAVEYRRMVKKKYDQRIKKNTKVTISYDVEIVGTNGSLYPFDLSTSLVTLSGEPAVLITLREITQRKIVEENFKETEKKFRAIFESNPVGIVYFNKEGLIEDANEAFREIFDFWENKSTLNNNILDLVADDTLKKFVLEIMKGKSLSCHGEYQFEANQRIKSIKLLCKAFLLDGNLQGGIGIFEDVTLQKTAEKSYRYNKKRLKLLLELSQMNYVNFDDIVRIALVKAVDFTSNKSGFFYFLEKPEGIKEEVYSFSLTGKKKSKEKIINYTQSLFSTTTENQLKENRILIPIYENEKPVFVAGFDKDLIYDDMETRHLNLLVHDIWSIFQHKLSEQALKASEKKYSTLVEKGNDGIIIIQDGALRFANSVFTELVGEKSDELLGTELSSFVSEEYRRMVHKKFSKIPDNPDLFQKKHEIELVSKDGKLIPVEVSSSVIVHENKPAIMAIIRDITEQKEKEKTLIETLDALKLMQSVIRTSPAIVFFWSPKENWPVEFVSSNIENFGYKPDEFISGKLRYGDIIHPSDLEMVQRRVEDYSKKKASSYDLEYRIITKSGEIRWVEERASIQYDSMGRLSHYQGLILDITERKRINSFLNIETDMGQYFTPAGDIHDVFVHLLDIALHIEGIDCGALYVVDKTSGNLNIVAHKNLSNIFVEKFQGLDSESLAGRFLTVDYPVYMLFPEIYPLSRDKDIPDKLLASAILPIRVRNKLTAVLFVSSHQNYEISIPIRESLENVADQIEATMERIGKEADLSKKQYDLQILFDTIDELIFVIDTEGCIVYSNQMASEVLGFAKEELTGMSFIKLQPHNQVLEAAKAFNTALQGSDVKTIFNLSDKNGTLIKLESSLKLGEWNHKKAIIIVSRKVGI